MAGRRKRVGYKDPPSLYSRLPAQPKNVPSTFENRTIWEYDSRPIPSIL